MAAAVSLVGAARPDLRCLLSFNALERLDTASQAEKEALRAQVLAWSESHRAEGAWPNGDNLTAEAKGPERGD